MSNRPLPPRDLLLKAFNRIRVYYWGEDLDESLKHPIRGPAIIAVARRIERLGEAYGSCKPHNLGQILDTKYNLPPMRLDFKRLASGEREDD